MPWLPPAWSEFDINPCLPLPASKCKYLLQVPGDLVVRPVEHPQLPGVVCPVEEVEQQECEREEKSEVAIIYYDRLCRLTWQNYQFWKLNWMKFQQVLQPSPCFSWSQHFIISEWLSSTIESNFLHLNSSLARKQRMNWWKTEIFFSVWVCANLMLSDTEVECWGHVRLLIKTFFFK